jgi:putative (di)nucleoside polyphosphate hydrolase
MQRRLHCGSSATGLARETRRGALRRVATYGPPKPPCKVASARRAIGPQTQVISRCTPLTVVGMSQFFRASIGIAVLDDAGRVLALERYEVPGSWQLPQGGLDEGEEPLDAVRRELREETGLAWEQVELLGVHPRWLAYELDPDMRRSDTGRGQAQKWFVARLADREAKIDLTQVDDRKGHPEFRRYKWTSLDDLLENAVPFRLPVYEPLAEYIRALI